MSASIIAENLVKTYGGGKDENAVRALDGLSLTVEEGTVLSLLGPNGSGKTTTVRVLSTLLRPDSGRATVAGIDHYGANLIAYASRGLKSRMRNCQ